MPMDSNRIEELLTRYWEGETTLEEETHLREYFSHNEVPEHLKETATLFQYFAQHKNKEVLDTSFDDAVIRKATMPKTKSINWFYNSMRIAAGVVVLCVSVWLVRYELRKTDPPQIEDTYDDPRIAFEETKKALMMISKSFGTAEKQAQKINLFNKAQEEIQKSEKEKTSDNI